MKDAVAGRRVVRLPDAVPAREFPADGGLLLVRFLSGEDEMVVRDGRLPREDRVAAGDLVERVDGEGSRSVGSGEQVREDPERRPGPDLRVPVHAVRPDDLLGRRHAPRGPRVRPEDPRLPLDGRAELAAPHGEDAAAPPDFLFLFRERDGLVALRARFVRQAPRPRVEAQRVAIARVRHRLRALDHVEAEVEGVPSEDVPHVGAADDDELEARFLGDPLQAGRAHLPRGADREAVAGDEERLAAVHALAEVGHQVAEGPCLPPLVEGLEALGDAVGRRSDLVGVDRVALLAGHGGVPEDQGLAADHAVRFAGRVAGVGPREILGRHSGFPTRGFDLVHFLLYAMSLAIANAAAAARPPTTAVCQALRSGFFTVKRPFT